MPKAVERIEVTCATCGKAKKILPSHYYKNKEKRFFCDRKCQGQWKSKNVSRENHHSWSSIEVRCAFCGKPKFINKARFETTENFFCDTQCQMNWRKIHWKGENCPLSVEKVTVYCKWCGKPKKVIPYLLTVNGHFFCDRKCQGIYKSVYESKDKHGRWKGGKSYEPYGLGFDPRLKHQIKKRDGYKCQLCGLNKPNDVLHIHHIDYDKENHEPSNLITLCNSCHSKTNTNRESWWFYFSRK